MWRWRWEWKGIKKDEKAKAIKGLEFLLLDLVQLIFLVITNFNLVFVNQNELPYFWCRRESPLSALRSSIRGFVIFNQTFSRRFQSPQNIRTQNARRLVNFSRRKKKNKDRAPDEVLNYSIGKAVVRERSNISPEIKQEMILLCPYETCGTIGRRRRRRRRKSAVRHQRVPFSSLPLEKSAHKFRT